MTDIYRSEFIAEYSTDVTMPVERSDQFVTTGSIIGLPI